MNTTVRGPCYALQMSLSSMYSLCSVQTYVDTSFNLCNFFLTPFRKFNLWREEEEGGCDEVAENKGQAPVCVCQAGVSRFWLVL